MGMGHGHWTRQAKNWGNPCLLGDLKENNEGMKTSMEIGNASPYFNWLFYLERK
jgi:hypothetical protein